MTLRIVQITDCHLFADRGVTLRDIATWPRLEAVLDVIRAEHSDFDRLIVTGDVAHDEDTATYAAFRKSLGEFVDRVSIVPGNHDDRDALASIFPEQCVSSDGRLVFSSATGNWQLIGLDSQITGDVAGELGSEQLNWLKSQLDDCDQEHVAVFMHHPPVSVQCAGLDAIGLRDASQLLEALKADRRVCLVCCGHVHQASTTSLRGLTVLTTPAIGPQFRPRAPDTESDLLPAAARLIELEADGCWSSQVIRVPVQ